MEGSLEPSTPGKDENTKMQVLEKLLKFEASVTCSPEIISICDKYYGAIDNLTTICHTEPHFSHTLCGTGLNNIPLLFHLRNTETANILHLAQPQPVQKVLYVHRHSVILQDTQIQWKRKCPLLFYLSGLECSHTDRAKIFLSSRTHENMHRGSFGVPFTEESTKVLEDEYQNTKFFLSSQAFQANFAEQTPNFLCSYKPVLGIIDKSKVRDPEYGANSTDHDSSILSEPSEMYALKTVPALFHPDWPTKAFEFVSRRRHSGWPSQSLIQSVTAEGCYLIPAPDCTSDDCSIEWQLNFESAEKKLLQTLSILDKQAAFLFTGLICDRYSLNRGVITIEHMKAIILWTFEEQPLSKETEHPLLTRFLQICQKFLGILSSGCCRHYFIPERNLFDDIPMQVLEDIRDMVDGLLEQPWTFILHCHLLPYVFYDKQNQLEAIFFSDKLKDDLMIQEHLEEFRTWCEKTKSILANQVTDTLLAAFHSTVLLYVLTSCARLNNSSINESIIHHRDILRMVQDSSVGNELYAPYIDVVCTNLASLYHVKALTVIGKREREYFLIKAEAMMKQSKGMDLCLGRSRLANLLYSTNRFPEAVEELNELLTILDDHLTDDTSSDDEVFDEEGNDIIAQEQAISNTPNNFTEVLWEKWLKKKYVFDIIYNRTLRPLCPSVMKRAVSLTMCNTLGIQRHSVAVFSPIFHSRFLLALCHAGMRDNDQALPILLGLEAVLIDSQLVQTLETSAFSEVNEKRITGYYIVLGNCYLVLQENDKAKGAFRKAMKVFPSPRNPANLLYLSARYGDTITGVQQGAKALVVASAVSIAYNYVSSQL